jgi:hypothetical protein
VAATSLRACRSSPNRKESQRCPPPIEFSSERYEFAVPVMAEVYVSRLLDRDEFRKYCDHHKSRNAIVVNLA